MILFFFCEAGRRFLVNALKWHPVLWIFLSKFNTGFHYDPEWDI